MKIMIQPFCRRISFAGSGTISFAISWVQSHRSIIRSEGDDEEVRNEENHEGAVDPGCGIDLSHRGGGGGKLSWDEGPSRAGGLLRRSAFAHELLVRALCQRGAARYGLE